MSVRRAALALILVGLAARPAAAQVGTTTDIISGVVLRPDSLPLEGAVVRATSVETRVSRERTTDARGRFTIVFPDGGGRYELTARFIGMAPAQITVARQADEDRIEATIRMELLAVALEPLTVTARTGARADRAGPGASERSFDPERLVRLPIDASDLSTVATLQPGVLGIAASDSSVTAFSVAGQRPTANAVTLDGLSFGAGSLPQDAVRSIRVVTNGYDVARGQFSGGLVTSTTRSGTNVPQGTFTYALRDRSMAWGEATASPFGQGATQNQLGGGLGGAIIPNKVFVFAALQGRWRAQALPSLVSADPGTLVRLGVSPDSVTRFVTLASSTGVPITLSGLADDRSANTTLGLLRLDWQATDVHTLTLRFDGAWASQAPMRVGSLAFPATGGTRTTRGGGVMTSLTSSFGGRFINELRTYASRQRQDAHPYLALPAALVVVASDLADGAQGLATLSFGGNDGLPQRTDNRSLELADEFSWLPGGGPAAHRFKVGVDVLGTRVNENQTPNQLGTFVFPSLAAFAADSPAAFTRTVAPLIQTGTMWTSALYAGDIWRPVTGGALQVTYGIRLEDSRFRGAPANNRAVDSLFGVRTDRISGETHLSPRIGFTWALGPAGHQRTFVRGGIGDFRGLTPTALYAAALGAPGLPAAERAITCVGSAVPAPDWARYIQDPSSIPSQCADTGGGALLPRPDVTVFAPGFKTPAARRASLALVQRFAGNYWITLEGSYARGVNQYGFRDLNLFNAPRFTLPDEAGRPIYVPADSIVASTGQLSPTASRVDPGFGQVLLIRSDLQSDTKQLTLSFTGATSGGTTFRVAYTFTRARDQSSFSCCAVSRGFAAPTTGGDPNVAEWGTSGLERRHALFGTMSVPLGRSLEIGAIGRLTAGVPFTPIVGSDINGDGAKNDRAYIVDPASTSDTAVARAMQALLATAPSAVRACLRDQLGRIAARNSCTGPWQPSLDLQLNWRPDWFGTGRRLTLSLQSVNLLGGLDEWLHGPANLHGWGYATAPDPVLLDVQGFDPTTSRYRYQVNGRFGSIANASAGVSVPFQVALQGRLSLGPGLRSRPRVTPPPPTPTTPGIQRPPLPANPVAAILRLRDSLQYTPGQVARLTAISDTLDGQNRILADSMQLIVQHTGGHTDSTVSARFDAWLAAARENVRVALVRARDVLTTDQWAKLPGEMTLQ